MIIDGTWHLTLDTPMGERPATFELRAEGARLSGVLIGAQGRQAIEDGAVDGNDVRWVTTIAGAMGEMRLEFDGSVEGDSISGAVELGDLGSGTFTGTREASGQ